MSKIIDSILKEFKRSKCNSLPSNSIEKKIAHIPYNLLEKAKEKMVNEELILNNYMTLDITELGKEVHRIGYSKWKKKSAKTSSTNVIITWSISILGLLVMIIINRKSIMDFLNDILNKIQQI